MRENIRGRRSVEQRNTLIFPLERASLPIPAETPEAKLAWRELSVFFRAHE